MYRLPIAFSLLLFLALGVGETEANDYLVGGMFNTPRVTHYRGMQTGRITFYGRSCPPQQACPPQGGCQTAYYPTTANRPVTTAIYQPVAPGQSFVLRSNYTPYQLGQNQLGQKGISRVVPATMVAPATMTAPAAPPCNNCTTPAVGR